MLLKDFEDTLKNIENDRMLMSYGDNSSVVNNILSIVNMTQSLSNVIKADRMNDMLSFNLSNKLMEIENIVVMYGYQRLSERGINVQAGVQQQFSPMQPNMMMGMPYGQMPNMMMGQQMYAPQMYPQQPMMQQPYMQQPMPQQQMPQQPMPQAAAPQPAPQPAPAPAPAPKPVPKPEPVVNTAPQPKASSSSSSGGGLPGMGGGDNEKAAGRDFLLKLLEEKG